MPRHFRSLTIAFALALAAGPPARAAECPASLVNLGGSGDIVTTAARFDSTWAPQGYFGVFRGAFDLVAGTALLYHCCSLSPTTVTASDAFDVAGVPAGTPVDLVAQFEVDGRVWTDGCGGTGCGGVLTTRLQHGAVYDEQVHAIHLFTGSEATHDLLQVPLTIVAGTPERLDFILSGHRSPGGNHGSEGQGTWRFVTSTPGVTVWSCQGWSGAAVPARPTTWGRLKVRYR